MCLGTEGQAASEKLKPRVEERNEELNILSSSLQVYPDFVAGFGPNPLQQDVMSGFEADQTDK